MRRNSSFFWASDALRNLETDDDDDDDDDAVLNDELEPVSSQDTSDSTTQVGICLEAQHAAAMETTLSADEESQPLILSRAKPTGGYGSSNGPQGSVEAISEGQQPPRRFVFTRQEFGQGIRISAHSSSKSLQSMNRKKSMQPCVIRFQVV